MPFSLDVAVVGGCGRAGLPLGLAFAERGLSVALVDIDPAAVDLVEAAKMPFAETGAAELLERVRADGLLRATTDPSIVAEAAHIVIVVGTPVTGYLAPDPGAIPSVIERELAPHLRSGQLIVLRSTVFPGVTALVERTVARLADGVGIAFCPERIAEGQALAELNDLPQIVAARDPHALAQARELFSNLTDELVELSPEEAELAKLFTNFWRYVKFATANQLFIVANDHGLDFERIRQAMIHEYPRAADLPGAGFAAGPCLFKDTMQLAAYHNQHFGLGHASMLVNEGLPLYVVARLEERFDLTSTTVGVLGMAFKAGSDDTRHSLSYKLAGLLRAKGATVLCTDPYVTADGDLLPLGDVLDRADLVVVGVPHDDYRGIDVSVPVVDLWNLFGLGVRV